MAFDPTTDSWAPGEPPVGNASALPLDPDKPTGSLSPQRPTDFLGDLQARHEKVSGALAGEYGAYTKATSVLDQMEQQRVERDRGRMEQAFNMELAAANDPALTHPWNSDKERSERIRGPLENFGSVGTIFALAASAFTRTPMTSALNAAGAAMTAMHQSDEEGYKSAYEAWKANSDLAIKRFNVERNLYEDANKLVSTDLGLWRQKRASIAAQFDDRKRLILLENGMDAEVLKADEAFTQAGEKAIDFQKKFEDINLEKDIWQSKFAEWKQAHPPADPNNLTPQEHLEQYKAKNQFMLEAKHQVAQSKSVARTGSNPNQQQYDMIRQKYEGDPEAEQKIADEYAAFIRNQKGSTTGITGNEKVKLQDRVNKFHHSGEIIDKTLKVLETHPGAAGIAGKAMRLEERVGNILGAKSTDRVQMMRDIELLRGWAKELVFSSNSKLKKEAERVDAIVGGTSAGDTSANTIRALKDLKRLYDTMRAEDEAKLSGTWKPPVEGATAPPPTSGKKPWTKDPVVSP